MENASIKNPAVRQILVSVFRERWKKWSFLMVGNQVLPLLEVGLIFCIYTLIAPEQRTAVVKGINFVGGLLPGLTSITDRLAAHPNFAMLCAALVLLMIFVILRYLVLVRSQLLRYELEIADSYSLTLGFLHATPTTARKCGRERVVSSIIQDAGTGAACVKRSIDILAASWAVAVYLTIALATSWEIVAIVLGLYVVPLWVTRKTFLKMRAVGEVKNTAHENTLAFFGDLLSAFDRSKIDSLEVALAGRAETVLEGNFSWRITKRRLEAMLAATMDGLSSFGLVVTLFVAVSILQFDLALLLVMFLLFNRIKSGINEISVSYLNIQEILPNVKRIQSLLETLKQGAITHWDPSDRSADQITSIEVRSVSFGYDPESPVLRNLDFAARSGDRILITGPSGQGKSTFLELLAGLLPPDQGQVFYNETLLDTAQFYRHRDRISFVSPTLHLFNASLRANLTIGVDPARVEEALDQAIHLAGLDDVVEGLPDGLDSGIGHNGTDLSVGQRQRVLLARLYLKRPDLVLLDEATANLDPALEANLLTNLETFLHRDAIIVMIAHKPPQNYQYTRHYNFIRGQLVEAGSPANAAE